MLLVDSSDVIIKDLEHFDLEQTLDNGQAFRWSKTSHTVWHGIAHGRYLEVEFDNSALVLKNTTVEEYEDIWRDYFALAVDYGTLRQKLSTSSNMNAALGLYPGLRLMQQEPWEMLISFILSQNSNIPRIKKMILSLCENFGSEIKGGYTFPTASKLSELTEDDLGIIKSGYRAAYILDAARQVADKRFDIEKLKIQPTEDIKNALLNIHGVGPKVADCVLLFGFGRTECFPLDVWMKRAMEKFYPTGFPEEFAEVAGIAQQFLFHYARTNPDFASKTSV